ncbi:MAG TPA: hypothetical protein VKR54_02855 [Candidatus Babeliales bacterium]|jgi:hypothetical protein|nr:hypothetical protein [Candidatus Babeliales bacterium]
MRILFPVRGEFVEPYEHFSFSVNISSYPSTSSGRTGMEPPQIMKTVFVRPDASPVRPEPVEGYKPIKIKD